MSSLEKRWRFKQIDHEASDKLCDSLRIHPVICDMLSNRGISSFEEAKDFFRPSLKQLHDPFLMKDMRIATDRIMRAIRTNEKILIYGDYDVDGTTAVSVVFDFLQFIYPSKCIEYYIPDRNKEGYGLSSAGIDYAQKNNFNLLITLDCGIKSVELIQLAKEKQIDCIVCDHHLPGNQLPPAVAILNPKQPNCSYPFKELCGCGVGFKLIQALCMELELDETLYTKYLDLVATAIAADIVSITGENRTFAFFGLKKANENPNTGIRALIEQSNFKTPLSVNSLSFAIGPRINAAGRMGDAKRAVSLFIEKDIIKAKEIALTLQSENNNRKEADSSITDEALMQITQDDTSHLKKTIVVYNEHWHKGVLGIVASRLLEKYYKPTIVLTKSGDFYTGSARSIAGFNMYEGLDKCSHLLHAFGGHYFAAGMTIVPSQIELFKETFETVANSMLSTDDMVPEIEIDAEIQLKDIHHSFYHILEQMEPFGPDNTKPVFCVRNVTNVGCRIVKDDHLRFEVMQDNFSINGIGFQLAEKYEKLAHPIKMDIVFTIEENHFNGRTTLQMKVIDFNRAK
ncbi:MAG: single-stranded-DNA-specific exonuclease RecJ [Bacteroidetes bacterium]|nr:single-stranded-DNA-specific exonuclease RecJ [Bacteroidota bacterium]